jgi:Gpi18-like mannosyltransferase
MNKKFASLIENNHLVHSYWWFPVLMWLSSRLVILIMMFGVMPIIAKTSNIVIDKYGWWDVLFAWDSVWYYKIATSGYNYGADVVNTEYAVAFFPLYPLLSWILMQLGLSFPVAGLLINNLAFLGALIIFYVWVKEIGGENSARWATAALAWCPYSLYGTVIYTEGLFLLFSISALRAFDKKQYVWAGLWGALSTATRITGIALIIAFFLTAWKQRRPLAGYIASFAVAGGVLLYSLYCAMKFGDALAFVHAQRAWRSSTGFAWQGWLFMLKQIVIGSKNAQLGYIQDIWYPVLFAIVIVSSLLLWRFKTLLGNNLTRYGFFVLSIVLWMMAKDPLIQIVWIFVPLYLLWHFRSSLPLVASVYSCFSYGIALNTGLTLSVDRYVYAIAPVFITCGFLFVKYPRWGYGVIAFCGLILTFYCVRFAQDLWLA